MVSDRHSQLSASDRKRIMDEDLDAFIGYLVQQGFLRKVPLDEEGKPVVKVEKEVLKKDIIKMNGKPVYKSDTGKRMVYSGYAWFLYDEHGELIDEDSFRNDLCEKHNLQIAGEY